MAYSCDFDEEVSHSLLKHTYECTSHLSSGSHPSQVYVVKNSAIELIIIRIRIIEFTLQPKSKIKAATTWRTGKRSELQRQLHANLCQHCKHVRAT